MTLNPLRVSSQWLDLREAADAAARSRELVGDLRHCLPAGGPLVIHDLACGSGAMGRWLAPLLPGPQRWILHDRDEELLALAAVHVPAPARDGAPVGVETRASDITQLCPDDLEEATLITASALLDLLTGEELESLVHRCAAAACPVLFTLSVIGRVRFEPAEPFDARAEAAFNAHQRRSTPRGTLLGPDALEAAVEGFRRLGADVVVRDSPWRLGPAHTALTEEWLTGWLSAACESDNAFAVESDLYRRRRLRDAAGGRLAVTVGHADLLVLP